MIKTKNNNTVQKNMNIFLDEFNIDKRIIPLFRAPIILKKEYLLKKYKEEKKIVVQKKLIFRVKPLNVKLVKYVKILSKYKKKINKIILKNINNKNVNKYLFLEKDDLTNLKINLNYLYIKIKEVMLPQTFPLGTTDPFLNKTASTSSRSLPSFSSLYLPWSVNTESTAKNRAGLSIISVKNNNINNLFTNKRLFKLFIPYKQNNEYNKLEAMTNSPLVIQRGSGTASLRSP
jgi:hypothetical protein